MKVTFLTSLAVIVYLYVMVALIILPSVQADLHVLGGLH